MNTRHTTDGRNEPANGYFEAFSSTDRFGEGMKGRGHEASPSLGWRATYRLLGVTPPDEPCLYPPETLAALNDDTRTLRNRTKHARRTTT